MVSIPKKVIARTELNAHSKKNPDVSPNLIRKIERISARTGLEDTDWLFLRIARDKADSLPNIKEHWTLEEVIEYHIMMDYDAEVEALQRAEQDRQSKRKR